MSHEPATDYSIIIPAYNEAELLPATLERVNAVVAEITTHRGEIVVTDNDSTDGTGEIARRHGARVVEEPIRQIARSRNAGGKYSRGRYLIFVDADTLITAELLRQSLAALDGDDCVGGGTLIDARGDRTHTGWAVAVSVSVWNLLSICCNWACGAYVFCRRDAWEAVGGFDETYYASEEIHFSNALKRWGKANGCRFRVLRVHIATSMRKFHWYSPLRLLGMCLRLVLQPSRMKSREGGRLWYERPES